MGTMMSEQPRQHAGAGERDILEEIREEVTAELDEERPPSGGPVQQSIGALGVIALGLVGTVLSLGYGLGRLTNPGPGLWPFVISVLIVVLGVGLLVGGRHLQDAEKFTRSSILPAIGVLTFVGLAVLMPVIGFEIPSLLLCAVWLRWLGGESWRSTVVVSVGVVAAFYVLFVLLLGIPVPRLI
jgi:putative tricarboxylic transport membrane protein